ncbi:hypothetical protein GY45DRAFT_289227 [Cubamyces sp. BRFM 1775]|nr:hypothetical protein GY45DRAFT_289227 [Cubamyces sp. BRFM 1775]
MILLGGLQSNQSSVATLRHRIDMCHVIPSKLHARTSPVSESAALGTRRLRAVVHDRVRRLPTYTHARHHQAFHAGAHDPQMKLFHLMILPKAASVLHGVEFRNYMRSAYDQSAHAPFLSSLFYRTPLDRSFCITAGAASWGIVGSIVPSHRTPTRAACDSKPPPQTCVLEAVV